MREPNPTVIGERRRTTRSYTVGIIGFGTVGEGMARWLVHRGHRVLVKTGHPEKVDRLKRSVRDSLRRRAKGTLLATDRTAASHERIHVVDGLDELSTLDIIIESVKEDLHTKSQVWSSVASALDGRHPLLATTTSSLSIAEIARFLKDRSSFLGLHFFNPVPLMDLVEVIPGAFTEPQRLADAITFCRDIGKSPLVVKDVRGFLVNRVFGRYLNEASRMLEGGAGSLQEIDTALSSGLMLSGPFFISDLIGLDVLCAINRNLHDYFGTGRGNRFRICRSLEMLCDKGRLGRKTGKGYYLYTPEGARDDESLDEEIAALLDEVRCRSSNDHVPLSKEIAFLSMVHEATLCLEEGIVPEARDIDSALKAGIHVFRGPLAEACHMGGHALHQRLRDMAREFGDRFDPPPVVRHIKGTA